MLSSGNGLQSDTQRSKFEPPVQLRQVALPRSATGSNDAPAEGHQVGGRYDQLAVPRSLRRMALGQLEQTGTNGKFTFAGNQDATSAFTCDGHRKVLGDAWC